MVSAIPRRLLLLPPILLAACAAAPDDEYVPTLHYVGSSTIGNFMRDAEPAYGRARFVLETEPESAGGERAVLEGRGDLAGVAGRPRPETLREGVNASLIGRDSIAVVVHPDNPLEGLTCDQLRSIFTGETTRWSELGGPDVPIHPYIVGPESATRNVFRSPVLGEADYTGCTVVRPDSDVLARVREDPGGIGQISFSFGDGAKRLEVDGQRPELDNADYPITRPLYLLWWPGRDRVAEFVSWIGSPQGEEVLLERFSPAGARR